MTPLLTITSSSHRRSPPLHTTHQTAFLHRLLLPLFFILPFLFLSSPSFSFSFSVLSLICLHHDFLLLILFFSTSSSSSYSILFSSSPQLSITETLLPNIHLPLLSLFIFPFLLPLLHYCHQSSPATIPHRAPSQSIKPSMEIRLSFFSLDLFCFLNPKFLRIVCFKLRNSLTFGILWWNLRLLILQYVFFHVLERFGFNFLAVAKF